MSPDQNLKLTIDSTRSLLMVSVTAVAAAGERAYSSMADWMMAPLLDQQQWIAILLEGLQH